MLISPITSEKGRYIKGPVYGNLWVIPYVRGRLVFAESVARAIEGGGFGLVLVDLPYFMNHKEYMSLPAKIFPLVSSLIIQKGDSSYVTYPFMPNDAPCFALNIVQRLSDWGDTINLRCIDDSNLINYYECLEQPVLKLKDDYLALVEGLEEYFTHPFKQLEGLWNTLHEGQKFFLEHRASVVKEYLDVSLSEGKKTLFICEYRLWWVISNILENKIAGKKNHPFIAWRDLHAALVIEDPYLFWAMGLLDDFPSVVIQFFSHFKQGKLRSFDKLKAIEGLIRSAVSRVDRRPSVRNMDIFHRYLGRRLCASLRLTPLPVKHLYDAVLSCVGRHFAKVIAREFLDYPSPDIDNVLNYLSLGKDSVRLTKEIFEIPDMYQRNYLFKDALNSFPDTSFEKRIKVTHTVRPYITKKESAELWNSGWSVVWAIEEDYRLHEDVCKQVKRLAEAKLIKGDLRVRKSWGSIGEGIHWKATLASNATGEDAIYIKYIKSRKNSGLKTSLFDEYTPTVFLFENELSNDYWSTIHDSNITQRNRELENHDFPFQKHPSPDSVYSVFYTYSRQVTTCDRHVYKHELSSITRLCDRYMGLQRYGLITKRPERFQCRVPPMSDPELRGFTLSEVGAAWAIKYADRYILVVARNGWKPSPRLANFAWARNVRIIRLSLSELSYDLVERLRILYFISTPLKKYPDRQKILNRFLE